MLLRVAVIGAGAAGLCAARHILSRPHVFASPVVFELTDKVGGTWSYDERVGTYDNGRPIHSSMYRDLRCVLGSLLVHTKQWAAAKSALTTNRTNLPKEVMMFPDFPFDPKLRSFLPHQEVQKYLEQYCLAHNIRPHIQVSPVGPACERSKYHYFVNIYKLCLCQFSTVVENVTPVAEKSGGKKLWEVATCDSLNGHKRELFDAVFVCSG